MVSVDAHLEAQHGLDLYFATEAHRAQKTIYGLETMAGQLEAVNSISLEAQAYALKETIREFDNFEAELSKLLRLWETGDLNKMEELLYSDLASSASGREYYQALVLRRNRAWLRQILSLCDDAASDTMFIVVGAGHLVGSDSLIEMLMREGFTAKRY